MSTEPTNVVVVGLGYFSQFHLRAWRDNPAARLAGVCDIDADRAASVGAEYGAESDGDFAGLLARTNPEIVDIIAPPPAHDTLVRTALAPGRTIICQKPFCTSISEAEALIAAADAAGATVVIHENFRFQPWHRETADFLSSGRMGAVYQARFALRPGDGRGPRAYLDRQPAFQTMPRLLVHETAVHFIDTFRWLFGPVTSIYAQLRRVNPVIIGEDAGYLLMSHKDGTDSLFDGNRLSDHVAENPRTTMGEMEIEGEGGLLRLDGAGQLFFRVFGTQSEEEVPITRPVDPTTFGGGCVAALIDHVIEAKHTGAMPENEAQDYLTVMRISEAAYRSDAEGRRITLDERGAECSS